MKYKKLLLFASTAFLFFPVNSQQMRRGMITGSVKDAKTKLPVSDAVITVSSSAFKGQRFAVTDTAGLDRINNSPPGELCFKC